MIGGVTVKGKVLWVQMIIPLRCVQSVHTQSGPTL